jgi:hypothetical protein
MTALLVLFEVIIGISFACIAGLIVTVPFLDNPKEKIQILLAVPLLALNLFSLWTSRAFITFDEYRSNFHQRFLDISAWLCILTAIAILILGFIV